MSWLQDVDDKFDKLKVRATAEPLIASLLSNLKMQKEMRLEHFKVITQDLREIV